MKCIPITTSSGPPFVFRGIAGWEISLVCSWRANAPGRRPLGVVRSGEYAETLRSAILVAAP